MMLAMHSAAKVTKPFSPPSILQIKQQIVFVPKLFVSRIRHN